MRIFVTGSVMERMYKAEVRWSPHENDNPIAVILRTEIDALFDAAKGIVRRHQGKPELGKSLRVCFREVDQYHYQDRPVTTDDGLDRQRSQVRFGYFSQLESEKMPELVEHADQAVFFREDMLKRERLRLAEAIHELIDDRAEMAPKGAIQEKIEWTASVAAFEHVFLTLAAQGYFKLPTAKGKQGDANLALFARQLLSLFDVPGRDGTPIGAEQLRLRLSPASASKLAEAKREKFQIPAANELIIPPAKEVM